MEEITENVIDFVIKEKAHKKLKYFAKFAPEEVGGLLEISTEEPNKVIIEDAIILKQTATGGDFELDDDATANFMKNLLVHRPDRMKKICGWWHKHPIDCWSGHDDRTFSDLKKHFDNNFIVGLVMTPPDNSYLLRLENGKETWFQFNTREFKVEKSRKKLDAIKIRNKCEELVKKLVKKKVEEISTGDSKFMGWQNWRNGGYVFRSYNNMKGDDYADSRFDTPEKKAAAALDAMSYQSELSEALRNYTYCGKYENKMSDEEKEFSYRADNFDAELKSIVGCKFSQRCQDCWQLDICMDYMD